MSSVSLPIGDLVKVTGFAILEVVFLCIVGFGLSLVGIIDSKMKTGLNRVNVSIFTPALLFSKVAFVLTPAKLAQLWLVPLFFVIVSAFSALAGWLVGHAFRLNRGQRAFAIACSMFNNSNSLPIAIMQSLTVSVPALAWTIEAPNGSASDTPDQELGRALSYLVIYSTLGIVLRWSLGVRLLSVADVPNDPAPADRTPGEVEEGAPPPSLPPVQSHDSIHELCVSAAPSLIAALEHDFEGPSEAAEGLDHQGRDRRLKSKQERFANPSAMSSVTMFEPDDQHALPMGEKKLRGVQESTREQPAPEMELSKSRRALLLFLKGCKGFNAFMTAPLWAALASIVIACIPPVQAFLNNDFPPLKDAIVNAGNCSVPITLVTLGAYFNPKARSKPASEQSAAQAHGERRTIFVSIIVRMVVVPVLLLPALFAFAVKTEVGVIEDPVFLMVMCLLIGAPPAITIAQLTTAACGDTFEKLISQTILYSYAVVTPITTIGLALVALYMASL